MMRRAVVIYTILILTLWGESFVVIVNRDSPISTITQSSLKSIYLKKRRFWNETKLVALNLPASSKSRESFEKSILKMSQSQLESYWLKQHYKGERPPYRVKSPQGMLLFVKRVKGAIGYIPSSLIDGDVKVIYRDSRR
jgi:ABC-type phosphate transport system substrate-binding protein